MGNYNSCIFLHPKLRTHKAARVILPSGDIRHLAAADPTTAAELMLEYSISSFLVDSVSLHMGRRFSPLPADHRLQPGHVYIMFPMRRLGSVVTAADVAVFLMSASAAGKRITGNIKVLPDSGEAAAAEEEVVERLSEAAEIRCRLSMYRSRKPLLDTIIEGRPMYVTR